MRRVIQQNLPDPQGAKQRNGSPTIGAIIVDRRALYHKLAIPARGNTEIGGFSLRLFADRSK